MRGAAATPATGFCASTRPARPSAKRSITATRPRARSRRRASLSDSPISFGTTPCSGFASTSVTVSYDERCPLRGNWSRTRSTPLSCPRRLVDHVGSQGLRAEPDLRPRERHADDAGHVDLVRLAVGGAARAVSDEVRDQLGLAALAVVEPEDAVAPHHAWLRSTGTSTAGTTRASSPPAPVG